MILPVFKSNSFDQTDVLYGFYGRQGGVSKAPFDSLNVAIGSGDNLDHVIENRARIMRDLNMGERMLITPRQIHSNRCVRVSSDCNIKDEIEGDAFVTDRADIAIGVLTADCTPVLFTVKTSCGMVIGAAHAGWKGALSGALENTIKALCTYEGVTPDKISACIGPTITQKSYEVDLGFMNRFIESNPMNTKFFSESPKPDKVHFDLPAFCKACLTAAGVGQLHDLAIDTYTDTQKLFSYRRACHKNEKDYGRQLSIIAIK